jgi:hypothetical protein
METKSRNRASECRGIASKFMALVTLSIGVISILTLYGCDSYGNSTKNIWRSDYQPYTPPTRGAYSPSFMFGKQKTADPGPYYVDSQQYGRSPWPISDQAVSYVNDSEIITYREFRYDYRSIDSDNQPRNHFRNYLRGYREGYQTR